MKRIAIFSWGYFGWGNSTPQLVKAVDAVESSREFDPPIFVDIRIQRSVRAVGFSGAAFEKLLGPKRHRWMKELGNKAVVTKKGRSIQIAEPKAANDLLDHAVESAKEGRRLIYFCSCAWPRWDGKIACHRSTVAGLLLKAARKQNKSVEIVEWPGGKPQRLQLDVKPAVFRAVKNGRMSIPLGKRIDLAQMAGLGFGSIATLHCGGEKFHRLVGPAVWKTGVWALPVLYYFFDHTTSLADYRKKAVKYRRETGLEPQTV